MRRIEKAMNNVMANLLINSMNILMQFVCRTVFIYVLGVSYLGINGLFSSILTILGLAELGVGSAIVYSMYQPLADNDIPKVKALMNLYRRCYKVIGLIVFVIGLVILPILPWIIKIDAYRNWIYFIYILYLLQTVISYWFLAYRTAIIEADQRGYVLAKLHCCISLISTIIKIVALVVFRDFVIYVVLGILVQIIHSLLAARKVSKLYPYLLEKDSYILSKKEKTEIKKNVVGLLLYKISSTVLTSTDNIIISIFIGVHAVGIMDNYSMIVKMVLGVLMILFGSYTSGIGNLYITEKKEKVESVFRCLNFANFWLYGFCGIAIYILINPFITLWIGKEYIVSEGIVFLIFLNMITSGLQNAVISFKDGCGLFWKGKYRPLMSAILNLIISILLVKPLGIAGVILGTILSRFLTTWWFDPLLLYKNVFMSSPKAYYMRYIRSLLLIVGTAMGIRTIEYLFVTNITVINFLLLMLLCTIIPNIFFWLSSRHLEEYEYFIQVFKRFCHKLRKKKGGI